MAALTALALGISAATTVGGLFQSNAGREKAEEGTRLQQQGAQIQAQAAQQQAGISKEQAAASVVYAGQERDVNNLASQQSIDANNQSYAINKSIAATEQQTELQKRNAMELDARRNQLEIIRNQQRGRALGLASATAQGAARGSGLQGGYGQISGQTGVNLLGVQQNLQIGENIFSNNAAISGQKSQLADLENQYAVQQANNQTAKSNIAYNYAVANAGFTTRLADTQTLSSQGAGLIAQGGGQVAIGQAQVSQGNSFLSAGQSIFSFGTNVDKLTAGGSIFGNSIFGGGSPSGYGA